MIRVRLRNCSNFGRRRRGRGHTRLPRAFTLLEVLAGLALLATLVVALLTARGKVTRQYAGAERRLAAVRVADELLAEWWKEPKRFPRTDTGRAKGQRGERGFAWRTRVVPSEAMEGLELEVVRLELSDVQGRGEVVLAVDVVLPKEQKANVLVPR